MRFSVNWLKQWVATEATPEELGERLTNAGLEMDELALAAPAFTGVVVAEITACEAHPDADKLKLCQVSAGDDPVQIVCGAPNARVGLKAPLAQVGAELPGGFGIKKAKLRGVDSLGMLCSAKELGLNEDADGLLELPDDAPVGQDIRDYLDLDDHSIELDLTPNRADCLSIRGLARDVSAICDAGYRPPTIDKVAADSDSTFPVSIADTAGCPRYVGRVIEEIDPAAKTPLWMVEALRRSGIRAISPVVDVTNYVLLELGQPLHAFDRDRLEGEIVVRRAAAGETLVLLDEREVELSDRFLAITDRSGVVALAGVMGGLNTGVTEETRNIFLESAYFDPATIIGKARDIGLHTDASHRFERGVDPEGQVMAIERATQLLTAIVGGRPGPVTETVSADTLPQRSPVSLRLARLNRMLGSDLTVDDVSKILESLNMRFERPGSQDSNAVWSVLPPSQRFDIAIEEDLIEEVARIYGYNRLPLRTPEGEIPTPVLPERQVPLRQIQQAMCAAGYQEVVNYSFIDQPDLAGFEAEGEPYALANPLSGDMAIMRTTLLPGLLKSLSYNQRRQHARIRLFETGVVFSATDGAPAETLRLAAVAVGDALPEQWGQAGRPMDFYDLKGDLEALLDLRGGGQQVSFARSDCNWLHPGQSAELRIDGHKAGLLGLLHPRIQKTWGIRGEALVLELDLPPLMDRGLPKAGPVSRFPAIRRDLSLLVPENVPYSEIEQVISISSGDLLSNLVIFDVYSGQIVEKGYKNLSIGLILQDVSSTLKDETVDSVVDRVIAALRGQLNAKLRG